MYAIDINKVHALIDAYKSGRLGGEKMPEDENKTEIFSKEQKLNCLDGIKLSRFSKIEKWLLNI